MKATDAASRFSTEEASHIFEKQKRSSARTTCHDNQIVRRDKTEHGPESRLGRPKCGPQIHTNILAAKPKSNTPETQTYSRKPQAPSPISSLHLKTHSQKKMSQNPYLRCISPPGKVYVKNFRCQIYVPYDPFPNLKPRQVSQVGCGSLLLVYRLACKQSAQTSQEAQLQRS